MREILENLEKLSEPLQSANSLLTRPIIRPGGRAANSFWAPRFILRCFKVEFAAISCAPPTAQVKTFLNKEVFGLNGPSPEYAGIFLMMFHYFHHDYHVLDQLLVE